jgi:hypothetical protein
MKSSNIKFNKVFLFFLIVIIVSFLIYLIMVQRNNQKNKKTKGKSLTKRVKASTKTKQKKVLKGKNPKSKSIKKQSKSRKQKFQNTEKYQIKTINQKSRKKLLDRCGLPDVPETQHCFNDSTHHTCCEIGPESSEYADSSGNPIGKLADDVFQKLPDNHPKKQYYLKNGRRPWCTCFGSKVCGIYSKKHLNDTQIRFINAPYDDRLADKISTHNDDVEEEIRKKFNVMSHGTPGV